MWAVGSFAHFQLAGEAENLEVAPPAGELAAFHRGDIEVTLEIELNPAGRETSNCLVVARTTREVSDELYRLLEKELEARVEEAGAPPEKDSGPFEALSGREVRWLLKPPEPLVLVCEDVYAELHAEAARVVQILRWLFNRPWPARPLGNAHLRWSLDGEHWCSVPTRPVDLPVFGGGDVELGASARELVGRLWQSGELVEPLARQILLEAVALREENPRAAFILAVVAAELGVKQFAAAQSGSLSEAWLLEEIQSPPLDRLVREYLVRLTDKKTTDGRAVPAPIATALEQAIKKRNRLIHRGHEPPAEEELAQLLVSINDLLYLLDWFGGNEWAFGHLQVETRKAYEA